MLRRNFLKALAAVPVLGGAAAATVKVARNEAPRAPEVGRNTDGARVVYDNHGVTVFDGSGVPRVRIGAWA